MKKSLLFAALLMGAMSVNAQTEYCSFNAEGTGISGDAANIPAGTLVGQSENVKMTLEYDDSYKTVQVSFGGYDKITVNGQQFDIVGGFTGSTNPSGQSLSADASTPVTSGCVVGFDVAKDGYLVVIGKMSSNKEYYAWEGNADSASPMAYTFAMDWTAGAQADHPTLSYTLPATELGYIDFSATDIDKYINGTKVYWPEQIVCGPESAVKKNGVGVIVIPVFAEAGHYMVHAAGSKISTCGAIFTTDPVKSVSLQGTGEDGSALNQVLIGDASGISNAVVETKTNENAPIYNLAGQRVSKNAKGLLIQNGHKYIK